MAAMKDPSLTDQLMSNVAHLENSETSPRLTSYNSDNERCPGGEWVAAEFNKQLWLAGPMIAVNVLDYSLLAVSVMFVGHLGELALASAALASSFAGVTGLGLLIGMGTALETLCGQAFGAKQYHLLGIYLQRGMLVLFITSIPVAVVWFNMNYVLIALDQDPQIAELTGQYERCLIPSLFAYAALQPLIKFLLSQSLVFTMVTSSAITLCCHIPLCYLMVFKFGFGFRGAAIATSISNWVNVSVLVVYVKYSSRCRKTWTSFSKEAFDDLRRFIMLAVPSAIMVCLEYGSFESLVILSGLLPNPELETSVFSVCLTTGSLFYMIPCGLGAATSTRVSNELGTGNAQAAHRAVAVSICLAAVQGSLVTLFLFGVRNQFGWAFTNDVEVVRYVARLMPLLAFLATMDAIQAVLSGVVRGGGWQAFGAAANLGSFYCVGLPISVTLAFVLHYRDAGLWIGMICAIAVLTVILSIRTIRTDWEQQARDAVNRVHDSTACADKVSAMEKPERISLLGSERSHNVCIS